MVQEIFTKCGHCGNISNCKAKAESVCEYVDEETYAEVKLIWLILQCPACSNPIFMEIVDEDYSYLEAVLNENVSISNKHQRSEEILYPLESSKKYVGALPYEVRNAYEVALKVQKIEPNAFAVLVGRTLEVICIHEKASGRNLADKIKYLADSGRIPGILAVMAKQLKELRNLGAHTDEDEVRKEDVSTIREFVDAILEYLYIAPAKITQLQERLDSKHEEHPF